MPDEDEKKTKLPPNTNAKERSQSGEANEDAMEQAQEEAAEEREGARGYQ